MAYIARGLLSAVGRGGPGGGARVCARTYFSAPVPRIERSDIEAMGRGRKGMNRPGAKPLGVPLNEFELLANGRARVNGFARLDKHCGVALCDAYLRFCYGVRRPYIAVASRGHAVVVDLRPAGGFGRAAAAPAGLAAVAALRTAAAASLRAAGLPYVNHALPLRVDEGAAADVGLDGSNEGKRVDDAPAETFTVLPPNATAGKEWARAFFEEFAAANGRLTRADVEARAAATAEARRANIRRRMFARTDALVADPVRMREFPPGTFDGYIAARAATRAAAAAKTAPATAPAAGAVADTRG